MKNEHSSSESTSDSDSESVQIVDRKFQIIACGEVTVSNDGLCHFYPSSPLTRAIHSSDATYADSSKFGRVAICDWHRSGSYPGCCYHFRFATE